MSIEIGRKHTLRVELEGAVRAHLRRVGHTVETLSQGLNVAPSVARNWLTGQMSLIDALWLMERLELPIKIQVDVGLW